MKKVITAILAATICAFVYFCISYVQAPVSTISAYNVTYEEVVNGDAFIVRKETIYTAERDGTAYSFAREGARVGNSRRICAVYSGEVDESVLQELGTINDKIAELGSVVVDNSFTADTGSTAQRLVQLQEEIEAAAAENDIKKISECKEEIELLASGTVAVSNSDRLAKLVAERQALESKLVNPRQDIYSTEAGIYSTKIDGYENVLNFEVVDNITVEEFAKIKPEQTEEKKEEKDVLSTTLAGDKVCKIIDNHEWYVMALVKRSDIEGVKAGDEVDVRFDKLPGEQVEATVVSVSNDPEGQEKAVVVLKCESFSEGAFSIRASGVEIIRNSYSGFEVPIHAIRVSDGQNGVMVRVGGSDVFKPCKMIYQDEENAKAIIVPDTEDVNRELMQYDMIIVGEK